MKPDAFLQLLREQLAEYYRELDPLFKEKEALEDKVNHIQQCIDRVKLLEEAERARLGETVAVKELPPIPNHRFESVRLDKACRSLLQEHLRMNLRQFEECLRQGGFQFSKDKKPGRQIHFALIRVPEARRRSDGIWEWQSGQKDKQV